MKGLVIKTTGTSYGVYFPDGTIADCHVKGNFRIRGIRSTNPVAIGDHVEVITGEDGTNWITELHDRKTILFVVPLTSAMLPISWRPTWIWQH